jgi:uncharacterized protein with PQ loop repeat
MTEQTKYSFIPILASILTILAFSQLVHRVYYTKHTKHLTFVWIFFILTSQILLLLYGILNNAYGIFLPAGIIYLGVLYILYVKFYYDTTEYIETELNV